jgi:hypothetical protein
MVAVRKIEDSSWIVLLLMFLPWRVVYMVVSSLLAELGMGRDIESRMRMLLLIKNPFSLSRGPILRFYEYVTRDRFWIWPLPAFFKK